MTIDVHAIETRRMNDFANHYRQQLQTNMRIFDFCQMTKDLSKKEKGKEGLIYHKSIHTNDLHVILYFLHQKTSGLDTKTKRCIGRCSYKIKNIIFNYFAVKFPDLMREIPNHLHEFRIDSKLTNPVKFAKQWKQAIDNIQTFASAELELSPLIRTFDSSDNDFSSNDSDSFYDNYY